MADKPSAPQNTQSNSSDGPLTGRHIAVGITGGIASYKIAALVSKLTQQGADVRVLMTEAATHFIGPATLASLSGKPVLTSIWQSDDHPDSQHIGVARWTDLLIIAPATANIIAKVAHGFADDAVSLVACAMPENTPVLIAPAMNADMWANPAVQNNVRTLRDVLGHHLVGPEVGWQACRTVGAGRMSEPETILQKTEALLKEARPDSPRG